MQLDWVAGIDGFKDGIWTIALGEGSMRAVFVDADYEKLFRDPGAIMQSVNI